MTQIQIKSIVDNVKIMRNKLGCGFPISTYIFSIKTILEEIYPQIVFERHGELDIVFNNRKCGVFYCQLLSNCRKILVHLCLNSEDKEKIFVHLCNVVKNSNAERLIWISIFDDWREINCTIFDKENMMDEQ